MFSLINTKRLAYSAKLTLIIPKKISYFQMNKMSSRVEEHKAEVDGVRINYVKAGFGDHAVLLLPGAMGTIWTDFEPQIKNLGNDKLTVIAWDPPGYGKSRPPDRTFPDNFFERDASWAHDLMKNLGYAKFSLLGWSDGGITSLLLAALYPNSINKMIVIGTNAYILPEELKIYESVRDIDSWSEKMRAPLVSIYGEDYFRKTWTAWVDAMVKLYNIKNGDICKNSLSKIECPTLIVHGARDKMVNAEHPIYLQKHLKQSKLKIFEQGSHNLHLRYHEEFNALARTFLLEK